MTAVQKIKIVIMNIISPVIFLALVVILNFFYKNDTSPNDVVGTFKNIAPYALILTLILEFVSFYLISHSRNVKNYLAILIFQLFLLIPLVLSLSNSVVEIQRLI